MEPTTNEALKELNVGELFERFISTFEDEKGRLKYRRLIEEMVIEGRRSLFVDFGDIIMFNQEFAMEILNRPMPTLKEMSSSLKSILMEIDRSFAESYDSFFVRIYNLPESRRILIRNLRAEHIGKLISVEGVVTRASEVKPLLYEAAYECKRCGAINKVIQPIDEFKQVPPNRCEVCNSKGPFTINTEESKFIDWQIIRIQEKPEDLPAGQLPRSIEVLLKHDLVDTVRPGDHVRAVLMIKALPEKGSSGKTLAFKTYAEANYIETTEKGLEEIKITEEDVRRIKQLAKDPNRYEKLVNTIAPFIHGYRKIKEALLLQLVGGVPIILEDGTRIRGDIHILLVGDPGTAKSMILQHVSKIAPRGIYTVGKGATAAGLTASVVRDAITGTWTLEAGALVLADQGLCAIDEFDKMDQKDRVAIHEAMEQQTTSIAKAGIVATLNTRVAILAAANPRLGQYDLSRSIPENVNLSPTILSRFDLIFVLTDQPDATMDAQKVDHIFKIHETAGVPIEEVIPTELFVKYIAYVAKNFKPVLTEEAKEILREYYLRTRRLGQEQGMVYISLRQLQSLIRLAQAHAKIFMRNKVTAEDAQAAIDLMDYYLNKVLMVQQTDFITMETGMPPSQRKIMDHILRTIKELSEAQGREYVDKLDLINILKERYGYTETDIENALSRLSQEGLIYSSHLGKIKLVQA